MENQPSIFYNYLKRTKERKEKIIKELQEKGTIYYLYTPTGSWVHLSVNDTTFCYDGARLISDWKTSIDDISNVCNACIVNIRDNHINSFYRTSLRCRSMIKKKINGRNKQVRCSNSIESPSDCFCNQHKKCFSKYLGKYIIPEILDIIYKKL